ncbi:MAG: acetyl-CoA carboxylase, carboxyltransferase subunit beta [Acutalibacteraceae bacterium]|nr:acetyl-CoA carboxylase, carboxyltransferase subunit beta [Acutalibacteraceae bacterium]
MFNGDFFTFLKPKNELEKIPSEKSTDEVKPYVPDALWVKCPECKRMILATDLDDNSRVCTCCKHHFRITARQRIEMIADKDSFEEMDGELVSKNIIGFPDYNRKLAAAKNRSGENESVITGVCTINGYKVVMFVMDPSFMIGSMGTVTGEKITRAFEYATENEMPVVAFTLSGGARMQEGILSLMQMAKTSGAVKRHSDAGLLYITILTDPTTGGVTASFAMEGDIILSEPGALVAFAGPRVIEQTIRQKLPKDFQTAEFLQDKGFVDAVVDRREMKNTLAKLLSMHEIEKIEVVSKTEINDKEDEMQ